MPRRAARGSAESVLLDLRRRSDAHLATSLISFQSNQGNAPFVRRESASNERCILFCTRIAFAPAGGD